MLNGSRCLKKVELVVISDCITAKWRHCNVLSRYLSLCSGCKYFTEVKQYFTVSLIKNSIQRIPAVWSSFRTEWTALLYLKQVDVVDHNGPGFAITFNCARVLIYISINVKTIIVVFHYVHSTLNKITFWIHTYIYINMPKSMTTCKAIWNRNTNISFEKNAFQNIICIIFRVLLMF